MGWSSIELGDGVQAAAPTAAIQDAVGAFIQAAMLGGRTTDSGIAVFSRYDLEANLVTAWFSPGLESVAQAFRASSCEKPVPVEDFGFLVGYPTAWDVHFPGYLAHRRSRR